MEVRGIYFPGAMAMHWGTPGGNSKSDMFLEGRDFFLFLIQRFDVNYNMHFYKQLVLLYALYLFNLNQA